MSEIARSVKATIASGAALSGVIEMVGMRAAGLITPATLDATTVIGFKVCDTAGGTFVPLCDYTGALVKVTVDVAAAKAFSVPFELFAWGYVKLWAQAAGVDVNQTGDKVFSVVLKP